jgi:hypothetical protein
MAYGGLFAPGVLYRGVDGPCSVEQSYTASPWLSHTGAAPII